MNDQEWQCVEEVLSRTYPSSVELDCDGYRVTLDMRLIDPFRRAVMVFVGGSHRVRWILDDCEERRRFLCPRRSRLWKKRERESYLKIGKKTLQKLGIDPNAFFTTYSPWWTSFKKMRTHFEANNRHVHLITPRPEKRESEAA